MSARAMVLKDAADMDWCLFEKRLYKHFGVNAVALEKNGARRTSGELPWANQLCALIKKNPMGAKRICDRLLRQLIHSVAAKKCFCMDECAAGMNKIVFPILQNCELCGFVNICGRPFGNTDRIYTDTIQEITDVDAQTISRLLPSLHPLDPRTFKEIRHFVAHYAQ